MKKSALLLASFLTACGGHGGGSNSSNSPNIGYPNQGWTNFGMNTSTTLPNPFTVGTGLVMGYVYTQPPATFKQGATITLSYTITGNPNYAVNDPNDTLPASITLFAWGRGDNLTCQGNYVNYRMWNPTRGALTTGSHTLTGKVDGNVWTNCYGKVDANGFASLLNNLLGVGFTFGGANFYGHGVTSNPSVQFKVDNYVVQ